jgi:hypothetical protein
MVENTNIGMILVGKHKGKHNLEDVGRDERITLK